MSNFYFNSGGEHDSSDDSDIDNLPYPLALPRSDFLSSSFDAPAYLSTLSDRHQTLEDLRSDLRERSQALSKELLDLVNANYEQFLSFGADLKGGEEKIEDVRVGLLGFRRGVEEVRGAISKRRMQVEGLLGEKQKTGRELALGRKLLEFDARLEELEDKLLVASLGKPVSGAQEDLWSDSEDEDDEEETNAAETGPSTKKLQQLVDDCRHLERLSIQIGNTHPFIVAQESRMVRVRNTLLLDLSAALKQTAQAGEMGKTRLLEVLSIYRDFEAGAEAVKILKDLKL